MYEFSFEPSRVVPAVIVPLATLCAVLLLAVVLAYWTWAWFAPRAEPRSPVVTAPAGRTAAAFGLFGQGPQAGLAATSSGMRLLGVVAAAPGRQGYAVMQLGARDVVAASVGEDFAPGLRLAEVQPDHVIVLRNGVRETLDWPTGPLGGARK